MVSTVTAAIVVAMILASSVIVVNFTNPLLREARASQSFVSAVNTLTGIDSVIKQVLVEGPGAKRSINVILGSGSFIVNDEKDEILIALEDQGLLDPGDVELGDIRVESGTFVKGYEDDVDGDGDADYVIENSAVLFAVGKKGSPAQNVTVNTSSIISLIDNKRSKLNITPTASILIDDSVATGDGLGYTELTKGGSLITEAEIKLFVNATNGVKYTALFKLRPEDDYVRVQVVNVTVPLGLVL